MVKMAEVLKALGRSSYSEQSTLELLKKSERFKGKINSGLMSTSIDAPLEEIVAYIKSAEAAQAALQEAAQAEQDAYNAEVASILITSGYSFEGYKITRYSGYISGDDCVSMPREGYFGSNKVADNLCGSLVKIRRQALKELKEAAYDLGCNAVIGVDFDYIVMDPQHGVPLSTQGTVYDPYVICVTANGNAVVIEKTE